MPPHTSLISSWLLAIAILATASPAFADEAAAKHIKAATQLHKEGKFDDALEELQLAYALDPQPNLLYAIGQVHVKLGHCSDAIAFYERFLATNPDAGPASAAKQAIDVCKRTPPKPEPTPAPEPATKPEPKPEPPVEIEPWPGARRSSPWYADKLGHVLVGTGVVAGAVGIVMYRSATSDLDAAETAATYQASQDLVDGGHKKRTIAAVAGAGGLVLIGAGVIHYIVSGGHAEERSVAISPTAQGGMVTWSGRF